MPTNTQGRAQQGVANLNATQDTTIPYELELVEHLGIMDRNSIQPGECSKLLVYIMCAIIHVSIGRSLGVLDVMHGYSSPSVPILYLKIIIMILTHVVVSIMSYALCGSGRPAVLAMGDVYAVSVVLSWYRS